jgi:hypothetical protein
LLRWLDAPETTEVIGPSGQGYQIETESFWDNGARNRALRVAVSIDDYGWRAFFPLTDSFIKTPDDQFVGESHESVPGLVLELLEARSPANVDRQSVLVTGEADLASIVLIPHRQLGGYGVAVFAHSPAIEVLWAKVTDLSDHDQLDLGIRIASIPWNAGWETAMRNQLYEELDRQITLVVRRAFLRRALYAVMTIHGRVRSTRIGLAPKGYEGAETTSLAAGPPIAVSYPIPVENWRKWA